jgi:hypothetical protein
VAAPRLAQRAGLDMDKDLLALAWKLLLARRLLGVLVGVLALVMLTSMVFALVLLWGLVAFTDSLVSMPSPR